MRGTLIAFVLIAAAVAAAAQQNIDRSVNPAAVVSTPSDAASALSAAASLPAENPPIPTQVAPATPIMPKVWCGEIDDAATKAVCWRAYQASLSYYETGLAHRTRVFEWQHYSTIVIFITVLGLVAAGIFFAWLQFKRDMTATAQSLELSTSGVKLTSTFLGVVILTLSLAFFYLYLVYVYPIHELF